MQHNPVVSRAPLARIAAYKARMGWDFPWMSSFGGDFNFDFGVSFTPEQLAQDEVLYNFTHIDRARANDELPGMRPADMAASAAMAGSAGSAPACWPTPRGGSWRSCSPNA